MESGNMDEAVNYTVTDNIIELYKEDEHGLYLEIDGNPTFKDKYSVSYMWEDILLKSDKLKTIARNNTVKDFEFSYFDDIDDALIEGLQHNRDLFSLLLSNDEIKRQVLGIYTDEIYKSLRET